MESEHNGSLFFSEDIWIMLTKKTVDDIDFKGLTVLCRCDFNVPIDGDVITDDKRLVDSLPTIKKLINDGAKVVLCSHFGKPKGPDKSLSLAPVARRLSELLGKPVEFLDDDAVVSDAVKEKVASMNDGDVVLLQNTRFREEEKKNGEDFAKDLASLADIYVNDAFGTAHREHASTYGVTKFIDTCVIGYLMEKEVNFLVNVIENPERPFVAVLGGSKVSSKIGVIDNLLDKVDTLIIGGGMTFTFIKALGGSVGKSLVEDEYIDFAGKMVKKAEEKGVKLLLPTDIIAAKEFDKDAEYRTVAANELADDEMGLDIGPETAKAYAEELKSAKTVVWNGPMGVFEFPNFANGTKVIAETLASMNDAVTIIGGGDSAAAVNGMGLGDKYTHVSTGGGASLMLMEGEKLPGVEAADDK